MSEIKTALERIGRRVAMPEPALDRMLRRRERRQRNERIAAAGVGLGLAAGIVGAVLTLRITAGTTPASGGDGGTAAAEGGEFVLPTLAIWTAIAVLVLTASAAVRIRSRLANVDMEDVEQEEPDGTAAPARRPAAVPGTAPREGGTEMDSKQKDDVAGLPRAQMPGIGFDDRKLRRANRWLVGAVVVLAVAVVALGVALIASSSGETAPVGPTSDPAVARALDGWAEAYSRGDVDAAMTFFAEDAAFELANGRILEGHDEIRNWFSLSSAAYDLQFERASVVVGRGGSGAALYRYSGPTFVDWMVRTVVLNDEGKITSARESSTRQELIG